MATLDNILYSNSTKREYNEIDNSIEDDISSTYLDEIDKIETKSINNLEQKRKKGKLEIKSRNPIITNKTTNRKLLYIKHDDIIYTIDIINLQIKEPDNILCKTDSREYKISFDSKTGILEYQESIYGFQYILDYIRNYNIKCFKLTFLDKEQELYKIKTSLSRLKFTNFLEKLNNFYPILKIGNYEDIFTKQITYIHEPNNILFNDNNRTLLDGYEFYHDRDENIFKEWLLPYLRGDISVKDLSRNILELLNTKCKIENRRYIYQKIICDIQYYNLTNLLDAIMNLFRLIKKNKS